VSTNCPPTRRTTIRLNHDQATTGTVQLSHKRLGSIMVLHPGHPLAGRTVPVVRRYRQAGERQWVIELPDGSRQYVPASWCTPLLGAPGSGSVGRSTMERSSPSARAVTPLSLTALRDLAALVRRLREAQAAREGEQQDAAASHDHQTRRPDSGPRRQSVAGPHRGATAVGELPGGGPPAGGTGADPDRPAAGAAPATERGEAGSEP
jgi:hypothetical protein